MMKSKQVEYALTGGMAIQDEVRMSQKERSDGSMRGDQGRGK